MNQFIASKFTMVIFGGAGDLAQKKLLPTIYLLFKKGFIKEFSILGFGLPQMSDSEYRENIKKWLSENIKESLDQKTFSQFIENIFYLSNDLKDPKSYSQLCKKITDLTNDDESINLIYYFAVPPNIFTTIVDNLSDKNLCRQRKNAKVVIEKPFGHNKKTAHELNLKLLEAFDEKQIYRIDHYLGKETVQNVFFFRFGNALFEPLWNRNFIDHIQITVFEDIGIENRGFFYESASIIGDIVQNHIMQLIALIAMEPPPNFDADSIRNERLKVLKSIQPIEDKSIVLAQYEEGFLNNKKVCSYLDEKNVDKNSNTPTFFAGKFFIDNWRWANVPFYVRAGKRLKKRFTEVSIHFKFPPLKLLGHKCKDIEQNQIVFSIFPKQKIELKFNVKYPGMENIPYLVDMMFDYKEVFNIEYPLAYERILIDTMKSDITLFATQKGIEAMWSNVDPIVEFSKKLNSIKKYPSGSIGPEEAVNLIEKDNRKWRDV
ncbi:MAG: glucose-6-phosphate dehydrogenase [Chlamydiae bacterium RIFCSPHIGHO2_12_FULL_27_8]|nr:MAG: glucose-6-phosphate dehydrogenase [Chlamydiae bacterium RIFCSPHIGHO2_12_FULL_27_8]OGN66669.1 MAG: glucose-6-phosphate dehydrogenase [Chlamydiae bacterium RIFCSPLOWO2_01_FULL_28_7]